MVPILQVKGVSKIYSNGIYANKNVNFSVFPGEIHALMGENGAGKSTLMKILFGMEKPDGGEIYVEGQRVEISSPIEALRLGIGMVHQHFMLVPSLTVAENMILCQEPRRGPFINRSEAIAITTKTAEKYHLPIDPKAKVADLSVGMKQRVEIIKALYRHAKILILDEPTAVITPQESEELFVQLKKLRELGHTVIFISHKIREVKELCDRVTIIRQGQTMGSYDVQTLSEEDISSLMIGRKVSSRIDKQPSHPGKTVLSVKKLYYGLSKSHLLLKDISFRVRAGEILGIAGVEGNGQRELVEIITGLRSAETGSVWIGQTEISNRSVRKIRRAGVSHIPQDRLTYGAAIQSTIAENLISDCSSSRKFYTGMLYSARKIREYAKTLIRDFEILCDSPDTPVGMLSGGNMQKVVVARELREKRSLIIADQPTRGIDVGTAELIHKRLLALRDQGAAVLLISADLNEIISLSDAVIVFYNNRIVAYLKDVSSMTDKQLGRYMLGIDTQTSEQIQEVADDK